LVFSIYFSCTIDGSALPKYWDYEMCLLKPKNASSTLCNATI